MASLKSILKCPNVKPGATLKYPDSEGLKLRVKTAVHEARSMGYDPLTDPIVVDYHGCKDHWSYGYTPCITASRGTRKGYWITMNNQGPITIPNMLRLQGLTPSRIKQTIPDSAMGKLIGNAFTQSLVEALLTEVLPVCGKVHKYSELLEA